MFNIQEELKKLPEKPGVYIMHDAQDNIIYVGKAIKLKNRVRQYFQSSRNLSVKIQQMVSKIAYFEYIITESELEALVLECNLIKEHRPKYNTMLKDDKNYPYIKVTVNEAFPRVLFARILKRDKCKYFGPYTSAAAVKDTIDLLQKIYKIRTCNKKLPNDIGKGRACLYYHMKQCDAPCEGLISKEEYRKQIDDALEFLNGNYKLIMKQLQEKMEQASQELEFEKAAQYRDLLKSVTQIAQNQRVNSSDMEERDIIAVARADQEAVVAIFFIRSGKLIGREQFHMSVSLEDTRNDILNAFVKQFYSGTPYIPREIILEEEIEEKEMISQWLSALKKQKVKILVPQKGAKHKLVELARQNAVNVLKQDGEKLKREEARTLGAVKEIKDLLGLEALTRMEAFDISNISGAETVGSMVVYEGGKPKRSDYRKFKIRTVKGQDDYKAMKEVLTRRFQHGLKEQSEKKESAQYSSFAKFPDLILMDGGKGQVNIAQAVLEELGLHIPVCGMVKDDNHRTRGLYYENEEIEFQKNSQGFQLVTRIQDEAHRVAISYHQLLRGNTQIKSMLDDIKGVGPARRKALMRQFKDISRIKEASVEELTSVEGITEVVAQEIYNFFH